MIAALALAVVTSVQADSLTLSAALARARAVRGAVRATSALVGEARAQKRIATAPPNPFLKYVNDDTELRQTLTVEQNLGWLLGWRSARSAGLAGIERAEADSAHQLASVAQEVRRAFYGALAAQQLLQVSAAQAALADTLEVLAGRRFEAGDISVVDKGRFALEAGRARRALSTAREAHQIALAELARATAADAVFPVGSLSEALDQVPDTAGASSEAIPLLLSARADSAHFARQLHSVRWSMVPLPNLLAEQKWNDQPAGSAPTLVFGLAMPFPLWSQRREYAAEAAAQSRASAAALQEVRAQASSLLRDSKVRLAESAQRARLARDVLAPTAQRIRMQTVQLYEAGRVAVLDVFDALRVEREVATTMVEDLLNYQRALADWYALLGRFQ